MVHITLIYLDNCYATGDVTTAADGCDYSGGFIGHMQNGDISTSYSSGSAANGTSGGFIGYILNSSSNMALITTTPPLTRQALEKMPVALP